MQYGVQNATDIFATQKEYVQRKPHLDPIKWREVTANNRKSNFPPNNHKWSKLGYYKRKNNECICTGAKTKLHKIKIVVFCLVYVVL